MINGQTHNIAYFLSGDLSRVGNQGRQSNGSGTGLGKAACTHVGSSGDGAN
jgi:hypothetical protein